MSSVIKTCRSCWSGPSTSLKYCLRATAFWWAFIPLPAKPPTPSATTTSGASKRRESPVCVASRPVTLPDADLTTSVALTPLRNCAPARSPVRELGVRLLAPCHSPRTVQEGDVLAQVGCVRVYGESRKLAVVRLVEPVGQPHQCYLRSGVRHQAVATGLVPGELLPVDEQGVKPRFRGVIGCRGATRAGSKRPRDRTARPSSSFSKSSRLCQNYTSATTRGTWSTATGPRATQSGSARP